MKFIEETENRPPEVNVVALIDVIFAVLTFFMLSSLSLSRTEGLNVNLPQASSGKAQDQTKIVITINERGDVALNKRAIDPVNLVPEINALTIKGQPTMVVINADKQVDHGRVVTMMDLVQQIPDVKLGIATQRK
jgi:biopolymer transport protein ExbD